MGFPGDFLVVADFINWAKENGIRVGPGRGSVLVRWRPTPCGITDLDPIQHGLLFERFLNPERVSMRDFDLDFDDRRRGEVTPLRHARPTATSASAQMITYGTIKAKEAAEDAAACSASRSAWARG